MNTDKTLKKGQEEQAEEALRESEFRYRVVADNTYDFEFWINPEGRFLYASPACKRIYGRDPAEFLADSALRRSTVHPDDVAIFDRHVADEKTRRIPGETEYRIVCPDGTHRWIAHACQPVLDEQGRHLGVRGSNRDITERKSMEEALRQLNKQLEQRVAGQTLEVHRKSEYNRSLIEASLDPLVTIGPDGKITDVNAATEQATGFVRKELIGTDFTTYFIDPGKARAGYEQAFREGLVRDYALDIRHKDGHTIPVLYNASVYRDEAGNVTGVFAAARDITERKKAEAVAKAERQRLYDVLETLPVYVILLSKDYHVPFANKFFRERFGESHGKCCFDYLFKRTEPCENCESYKALKTNAPHHWYWTGPDNRNYDIYDFPFVDADGSPMIMEMGIDITETKKAQTALEELNSTLEQRVTERTAELADLTNIVALEKDRLVALLNSITDEIWFADSAGKFTLVNPSGVREFAIDTAEPTDVRKLAENLEALRPDGSLRPVEESPPLRALRGEIVCNQEEIIRTPASGKLRYRQVSSSPVRDAEKNIIGSVSVVRDITDRKRAEEALAASEKRMQEALRVSHSFTFEWDTGSDRVTRSRSCAALLGLKGESVTIDTGQSFFQRVHPADRERFVAMLRELTPTANTYTTEYRILRGDGSVVALEEEGQASFDAAGKLERLIGVSTDITKRKQAEEEIRLRNEELTRFNRAMVDRELRMIELKKQVNELCLKAGLPPQYKLAFEKKEDSQ